MHAFLLVGEDTSRRLEEARSVLEKKKASEVIEVRSPLTKHSIESIRELTKRLSLKGKARGVILEDAHLLTLEAANAFLKLLEEPPGDTIIILTAPSKELVLETVSSRTQHIDLGPPRKQISQEEKREHKKLLNRLFKGGVGERFSLADVYSKNRSEALNFVICQTFAARELLLRRVNGQWTMDNGQSVVDLLEGLEQTRKDLEANVNVKLAIFDLLLHYPNPT